MAASTASRRYRARVVPRTGGGRSIGSRIEWERVGRIALTLVVFGILLAYVKPVINLLDNWQESKTASAELGTLKEEHERLSRRAIALKSPSAGLEQARKRGYVAPGETAYVIRGLGGD